MLAISPLVACIGAPCDAQRVSGSEAGLCVQVNRIHEAATLIQLGARIGLVWQWTGLQKKLAKRLYRELMGSPSPPGQTPFTDSWFVESDRRMLNAAVVWRLFQRLELPGRSQARVLIDVYQTYRHLVREPLLDLTRVALVPRFITMQLWHERRCDYCRLLHLAPIDRQSTECPGCRLYHRYRCPQCDADLGSRPTGRRRTHCPRCRSVVHRP